MTVSIDDLSVMNTLFYENRKFLNMSLNYHHCFIDDSVALYTSR